MAQKATDLSLFEVRLSENWKGVPKAGQVGPQISADGRHLRPNSLHVSAAVALAGSFGFAVLLA